MKILSHSYFASVLVCVFGLGFGMPALAEDCEIEVTGVPKGVTSFEVPLNFEGAAPEDAEWTVKDGEKVSRRFEAVARDGKLTLVRRGSLIILR